MAAAAAMGEVFENGDLVHLILRNAVSIPCCDTAADALRNYTIQRMRLCFTLSAVNLLFLRLCKGFVSRIMRSF